MMGYSYYRPKKKSDQLKDTLDKIFHLFIRLRDGREDGTFQCISCGRILPFERSDCGYFIKERHSATRYNEDNCHAQCRTCNFFKGGNIEEFRKALVRKYGEEKVQELERMKNDISKMSEADYQEMIDYYELKVEELKREKPMC